MNWALVRAKSLVSAVVSVVVSRVSLPARASGLGVPPVAAAPVETPTCSSDAIVWLLSFDAATVARIDDTRLRSVGSPYSTPLILSASLVALTTGFSLSLPRMNESVELYWSTNPWTVVLIASVSALGVPTTTETDPVVTAFRVSVTPTSPSVTTFDALLCCTPSIV